jgi:hypothetical protein
MFEIVLSLINVQDFNGTGAILVFGPKPPTQTELDLTLLENKD